MYYIGPSRLTDVCNTTGTTFKTNSITKAARNCHKILKAGLPAVSIDYIPQPGYELPMLNAVSIPAGTDDVTLRKQLLNEFSIEIGGGLGAFKAKAWRIGLMGTASTPGNVLLFLSALEKCLADQGVKFEKGASIAAAIKQAGQGAKE